MRQTRTGAFTLVELLVVLAILAVLAGLVGVGMWHTAERLRMKSAARTIVALARYARAAAVAEGKTYRLCCDLDEGVVWLSAPGDPETTGGEFVVVETEQTRPRKLPRGVRIRSVLAADQEPALTGEHHISFGRDSSATRTVLHLEDSRRRVWTLHVAGSTGEVKVYRFEDEDVIPMYKSVEELEAGFYRQAV